MSNRRIVPTLKRWYAFSHSHRGTLRHLRSFMSGLMDGSAVWVGPLSPTRHWI